MPCIYVWWYLSICILTLPITRFQHFHKPKDSHFHKPKDSGLCYLPNPLPSWVGSGQETTQHLPVAETSTSYNNNKYHQQKSPELSVSNIDKGRQAGSLQWQQWGDVSSIQLECVAVFYLLLSMQSYSSAIFHRTSLRPMRADIMCASPH